MCGGGQSALNHSYAVVYVVFRRAGKPAIRALWREECAIGYDAHITCNQRWRIIADKMTERIAIHDDAQTPYQPSSRRPDAAH